MFQHANGGLIKKGLNIIVDEVIRYMCIYLKIRDE